MFFPRKLIRDAFHEQKRCQLTKNVYFAHAKNIFALNYLKYIGRVLKGLSKIWKILEGCCSRTIWQTREAF